MKKDCPDCGVFLTGGYCFNCGYGRDLTELRKLLTFLKSDDVPEIRKLNLLERLITDEKYSSLK